MKKLILFLTVVSMLISAVPVLALADGTVDIVINGEKIETDVPTLMIPVLDGNGNYIGDRTMLPLRAISSIIVKYEVEYYNRK